MKRRILMAAILGLSTVHGVPAAEPGTMQGKVVVEPAATLPVAYDVDVLVAGGSLAGVEAACAAAERGANVLLIEDRPYLGYDLCANQRLWLEPGEKPETALTRTIFGTNAVATPMQVKTGLDKALADAGVPFLTGCYAVDVLFAVDGGAPAGVVMVNRGGRQIIRAKVIIDATDQAAITRCTEAGFRPFTAGKKDFKYVVVGGEPADGVSCRKLPVTYTSPYQPWRDKPKEFPVYEYSLSVELADAGFGSWSKAFQEARSLAWTSGAVDYSERLFYIPEDTVVSAEAPAGVLPAADVTIPVDTTNPRWTISSRLVGLHQVYGFVPDSVYADGRIAAWARRAGIGTSRFPGGTVVKNWDWENPSGQLWIDNYAPGYDPSKDTPESEWMSLDEYLSFVEASGMEPHFGVNSASSSAEKRFITEQEGIARAVRMVRYVKDRGHGGAWWYIGNEEAHWHGGTANYAQVCARYAQAMKAVDPDIKIFWNDNGATQSSVKEFLNNDGGWMDGLETHGKWPYGGSGDYGIKSVADWQNDFPLMDYRYNRKWRYYANNQYRKAAAEVGRSILVANNEYGLGKSDNMTGFTRYTKGLVMTELLLELFLGNWDMSAFWDMCRGNDPEDGLMDAGNNYRFNPFHFGMNMLADAQGGKFLTSLPTWAEEKADPTLHGFAARKDGVLLAYLLNKSNNARTVKLELQGASYTSSFARQMRNSADGYGQLVNIDVQGSGTEFTAALPAFSFTEFVFAEPAAFLEIESLTLAGDSARLKWSCIPGAEFLVEQSDDLIEWTPTQSNIAPDNLWAVSEIAVGGASKMFFRTRLQR